MAKAATKKVSPRVSREISQDKELPSSVEAVPSVIIPVADPAEGHVPRTINTRLTRRQGAILKAMLCAVREERGTCEMEGLSGREKFVEEYAHVVRWLLDKSADAWESETGRKLLEVNGLVF